MVGARVSLAVSRQEGMAEVAGEAPAEAPAAEGLMQSISRTIVMMLREAVCAQAEVFTARKSGQREDEFKKLYCAGL